MLDLAWSKKNGIFAEAGATNHKAVVRNKLRTMFLLTISTPSFVIPAKVGIHNKINSELDPRLKHSGMTLTSSQCHFLPKKYMIALTMMLNKIQVVKGK
jgi:hypothetical protein